MTIPHSQYREGGTATIDRDTCTGCGQCAEICPADVLVLEDGQIRVCDDSHFGCIACGHCMMVCPHECITVIRLGI